MDKKRIYGNWAGQPEGVPEDKERCIESVHSRYTPGGHQCNRRRGHGPDGLYCKQHAERHPGFESTRPKKETEYDRRMAAYRDCDRYRTLRAHLLGAVHKLHIKGFGWVTNAEDLDAAVDSLIEKGGE